MMILNIPTGETILVRQAAMLLPFCGGVAVGPSPAQ